ncbi:predicted protein [Postia placenta Mad-698-R]|nr:predicted protein [Postia placenta Mad-698-R]
MAPPPPTIIHCSSLADYEYQMTSLRDPILIPETEETWDRIANAMIRMTALVRGNAADYPLETVANVRPVSRPLNSAASSERTRLSGVAIELLTCLNGFNPPDLEREPRAREIEGTIRLTATDASADVRKIAKKIFEAYKQLLPRRVESFTQPLTPTVKKYLNIKASAAPSSNSNPPSRPPSSQSLNLVQERPPKQQFSSSTSAIRSNSGTFPTRRPTQPPHRLGGKVKSDMAPPVFIPKRPDSAATTTSNHEHDDDVLFKSEPRVAASVPGSSSTMPERPRTISQSQPQRPPSSTGTLNARGPMRQPIPQEPPRGVRSGPIRPGTMGAPGGQPTERKERVASEKLKTVIVLLNEKPKPAPPQPSEKPKPVPSRTKSSVTAGTKSSNAKTASGSADQKSSAHAKTVKSKGDAKVAKAAVASVESRPSRQTHARARSKTPALVPVQVPLPPSPGPGDAPALVPLPPSPDLRELEIPALVPLPPSPPPSPPIPPAPVVEIPRPVTPKRTLGHLAPLAVEQTPISALVADIQRGFLFTPFTPFTPAPRAGRSFEEGDNVRIESLGYEGTLKYLGEIDGKPGHWAGVELSGGFAGKGKNNGAVNGKQYFVCPPNCGSSRPSSVASSRNGRITPSFSLSGRITPSASTSTSTGRKTPSFSNGRATPSLPNGRVTPSAGRKTPGGPVPATRARSVTGNARAAVDAITPVRPAAAQNIITPGSRASNRTSGIGVGVPPGSPSRRNTPRARVPSGIAMPPPASPSIKSGRSISVTMSDQGFSHRGANSLTDLESNGKALQDKIAQLMAGRVPRPGSSASGGSSGHSEELQQEIERLHARLTAAEDENRRLRESTDAQNGAVQRAEKLAAEQKQSATRITELESTVRANERLLNERETAIEAVERAAKEKEADIEKIKSDADARLRDIQSKLDDKEALVDNLKELIEAKEGLQTENDAVLQAKNAEITLLEARVQKAYAELEDERQELGAQVEELRKAGQETIALYEERLSAADTQRYELEDLIASLDEQLRAKLEPLSPVTAQRQATSAVEIDNESLREQAQHLQKRIAVLEDQLEEAHATFDREEAADLKVLEENIEQSILREEALESSDGSVPTSAAGDVAVLHKKYEVYAIASVLCLTKRSIYREDELERELERLREKVARSQKKSSKLSTEPPAAPPDERPVGSGAKKISTEPVSAGTQEVCEICERPGHDIFTCDLLKDDVAPMPMSAPAMSTSMSMSSMSSMSMGGDADEELFCEDCEGRGHTAENCPHSLDVF